MPGKRLPFFVAQSKEKLTDRGGLALIDEFMSGLGFSDELDKVFPSPGSGRGIEASDYIRTLVYHFVDGGRHLEEIEGIKDDKGFRSLIKMEHMPGSDTVGDWLRRMGEGTGTGYVQRLNDTLIRRYAAVSEHQEFVFDVDGTIIESNKGDATYSYKGNKGYHPMLGWLSDGRHRPGPDGRQ